MAAKKEEVIARRISRVHKDLDAQWEAAFDRVYKALEALKFGPEYCERAATDVANDHQTGLLDGAPPEVPFWHEPDWEPPSDDDDEDDDEEEEEEEEEEEDELEDEAP
jgi:hypothetical protein